MAMVKKEAISIYTVLHHGYVTFAMQQAKYLTYITLFQATYILHPNTPPIITQSSSIRLQYVLYLQLEYTILDIHKLQSYTAYDKDEQQCYHSMDFLPQHHKGNVAQISVLPTQQNHSFLIIYLFYHLLRILDMLIMSQLDLNILTNSKLLVIPTSLQ